MKNKSGFTLVELLITIAVIGILATVVMINYSSVQKKSKISAAKADISLIRSAIHMLQKDTGYWPGSKIGNIASTECLEPSGASLTTPTGTVVNSMSQDKICLSDAIDPAKQDEVGLTANSTPGMNNWAGPYLDTVPFDPWKRGYILDLNYVEKPGQICAKSASDPTLDVNSVVIKSAGPDMVAGYTCSESSSGADDVYSVLCKKVNGSTSCTTSN